MRKVLHRIVGCIEGTPDTPYDQMEIILPQSEARKLSSQIDEAKARHKAIRELLGRSGRPLSQITFDVEFLKGMKRGDLLLVEYAGVDLTDGQHRMGCYTVIIDEKKSSPSGTIYMRIARE